MQKYSPRIPWLETLRRRIVPGVLFLCHTFPPIIAYHSAERLNPSPGKDSKEFKDRPWRTCDLSDLPGILSESYYLYMIPVASGSSHASIPLAAVNKLLIRLFRLNIRRWQVAITVPVRNIDPTLTGVIRCDSNPCHMIIYSRRWQVQGLPRLPLILPEITSGATLSSYIHNILSF